MCMSGDVACLMSLDLSQALYQLSPWIWEFSGLDDDLTQQHAQRMEDGNLIQMGW